MGGNLENKGEEALALPVLRDDLEIVPTAPLANGAPAWVIYDPAANRYFEIGRELLDISIRSAYDVFTGKVADTRSIDTGRIDEIAEGRVWIGGDALEIGLVDSLGGVDDDGH